MLIPCGKFGSSYLDTATAAARAALSVAMQYCRVSNGGIWLPVFLVVVVVVVFNVQYTHNYVDARDCIWLGAVGTSEKSLQWKLTLGDKSLTAPGNRTRVSIVPVFFFFFFLLLLLLLFCCFLLLFLLLFLFFLLLLLLLFFVSFLLLFCFLFFFLV